MSLRSERYVCLRGGRALPLAPVRLLLDLEARGIVLTHGADEVVTIRPASALTDEDRAALRRWKPHVLALLEYEREARYAAAE